MNDEEQKLNIKDEIRKRGKVILFFLGMIALVSTIVVSLVLQNNTTTPPVIDNIPINPAEARVIHVTGQVLYKDGKPFKEGKVELHSDVINTITDEKGWFLFQDVKAEEHTLSVIDKDGNTLAEASINLKQKDADEKIEIMKNKNGDYTINISTDVRYLELAVQIADDHLLLTETKTYAVTDKGNIYTVDGMIKPEDGAVILESGTVITEGNVIIHYPYAVETDNTVIDIGKDGATFSDKSQVDHNGNVMLPNGTVINKKEETVTPPSNTTGNNGTQDIPKDTPSQVEPDGTIKPVKPTPPTEPEEPEEPTNPDDPDNPDNPDPDNPEEPEKPTEPEIPTGKDGTSAVYSKKDVSWSNPWTATTAIDLFGKENAVIQPGSKGKYIFLVQNNRDDDLNITIEMLERSTHLPLKFKFGALKSTSDSLSNADVRNWKKQENGTYKVELEPSGKISNKTSSQNYTIYCLEWEWPYESGDDVSDTEIGKAAKTYQIDMKIHLED